jgi:hypothetical protein
MQTTSLNQIYSKYSKQGIHKWREDLIRSINDRLVDGVEFPSFPAADLQKHIQGNPNEVAIRGALEFRRFCQEAFERHNHPRADSSILLDFGTGWGRIARAFMRDLPADNIYAVEPFDFIIEARRHNPFINFIQSSPLPLLPFSTGFFSHIASYSIFTHFNKEYFDAWLWEFARLLPRGGMSIITTLGVHFLLSLKDSAAAVKRGEEVHFWVKLILDRIDSSSIDSLVERVQSGEFVWIPSDKGARKEFAECFVSDEYFRKSFPSTFEVVDYASRGELAQDCIVPKRR